MYPIVLNIKGKPAVVVGAGPVGRRRAESLAAAGAKVRLVDSSGGECGEGVEVVARPYEAGLLSGAALVLACTDSAETNANIAADARRAGALVNVADDPKGSDFVLPAVHQGGGVMVAVATVAGTPGLAATIRDELVQHLLAGVDEFAIALGEIRERLKAAERDIQRRREILRRISGPQGQAAYAHGGKAALEELAGLYGPGPTDITRMDGG